MGELENYEDVELLNRLCNNEEQVFKYLFNIYYLPVRRNILQFVVDEDAAKDILQDVFIALWEKRHSFTKSLNIRGWLFAVSYKKAISFIREKIRSDKLIVSVNEIVQNELEVSQLEEMDSISKINLLNEAIKELPYQRKKALWLYKIHRYSYQDIAAKMEISPKTAKQYVKMAMMSLRKYVHANPFEIPIVLFTIIKCYILL